MILKIICRIKCFQDLYYFNSVNNNSSILMKKKKSSLLDLSLALPLFPESKNNQT